MLASARKRKERPATIGSINKDKNESRLEMRSRMRSHFDPFLVLYAAEKPAYLGKTADNLVSADITTHLMEAFGRYLVDGCNTWQTARVYFSSVLQFIKEFHPVLYSTDVKAQGTEWQKTIRKEFSTECRAARVPLTEHKIPVCERSNEHLCRMFFERGLYEEGALQATDWSCGGRITEGTGLDWADLRLEQRLEQAELRCCIGVHWFRGKTATLTATYMFPHARCWTACCIHSLARLAVLRPSTSELIYPKLAAGKVVTTMNDAMKDIYHTWKQQYDAGAMQRQIALDLGIFPVTAPLVMPAGMTTHGNRAACIQRSRDVKIPQSVVLKHCGLRSSNDSNENSYDSVDFSSDSQV